MILKGYVLSVIHTWQLKQVKELLSIKDVQGVMGTRTAHCRMQGVIYMLLMGSRSVKWSTTERREIRNFPYPSMFELTGHQRLTVKRGIRNVGQFLAAEVTNPGQNESQEMLHSMTGWIKKGV